MNEYNPSTRIFVVILGLITGFTSLAHGIFAIMKGNISTTNILNEIGAFTIFKIYWTAGIVTSIISVLSILWVIFFIHTKKGLYPYILLSIASVFAGGGIAYIPIMLINIIVATQLKSKLIWWKKILKNKMKSFSIVWKYVLISSYISISVGVLIWLLILTPNTEHAIGLFHFICWSALLLGFLLLLTSIVFGFARDVQRRNKY